MFHLHLHVERDGPHTPCSHAKKLKNVVKGQLCLSLFSSITTLCLQMLYQVVLGGIGCIAPIKPTSLFNTIPCPMNTFYGNQGRGNCIRNHENKNNKPNVKINILDEGQTTYDKSIAQIDKRSKIRDKGIAKKYKRLKT